MEFRSMSTSEEDWRNTQHIILGTPSSVSSNSFEICRCCSRQNCENLEYYSRTMRKLESDTRLAAEIGQGLLDRHETYVTESNQQRAQLEKQINECHERIAGLEQSLDDIENEKDEISKQKNKWLWEYQKRQKILDETVADLEMANEKCNQLSMDLKAKESELEKLRLYKFMARHAESNEAILTSKLEDTNQELAISRKNELVLESKIKKLKTRYESLFSNHEQLSRQVQETTITESILQQRDNDSDTIKAVSMLNNNSDLICLIKELSSANTKLKADLINCKEQLSESRDEVIALTQKVEDTANVTTESVQRLQDDIRKRPKKPKRATSVKEDTTWTQKRDGLPIRSKTAMPPSLPSVSSSMPTSSLASSPVGSPSSKNAIVHHHYHYYVKNSKGEKIQITEEMDSLSSKSSSGNSNDMLLDYREHDTLDEMYMPPPTQQQQQPNERELVPTPSTSSVIAIKDGAVTTADVGVTKSPFTLLQEHVAQILDRLRGSDIRALNRRLKRAFEITELSNMSNSIIDNIIMDVDILDTRFLWVTTTGKDTAAFFPLIDLFKDVLKELGVLRNTVNVLQVEYVKKVEESGLRAEEEILKKTHLKQESILKSTPCKSNAFASTADSNPRPLSWFTNMFSNNSSTDSNSKKSDSKQNNNFPPSIITASTASTCDQHYYDRGSTLTKTTTNSSTLILSPPAEPVYGHLVEDQDREHVAATSAYTTTMPRKIYPATAAVDVNPPKDSNNIHAKYPRNSYNSNTIKGRPQMPYLPPVMSTSLSNNSTRSTPPIPIRNKRSLYRMHIDYEGIGPATIRPIPSDRDNTSINFSSSWLGGK